MQPINGDLRKLEQKAFQQPMIFAKLNKKSATNQQWCTKIWTTVRPITGEWRRLANSYGPSFVLLHHVSHAPQRQPNQATQKKQGGNEKYQSMLSRQWLRLINDDLFFGKGLKYWPVGDELISLLDVSALQPDDDGLLHADSLRRVNHTRRDDVTSHDATEDIYQDRRHLRKKGWVGAMLVSSKASNLPRTRFKKNKNKNKKQTIGIFRLSHGTGKYYLVLAPVCDLPWGWRFVFNEKK